jgi:hypothetical protein
LPSEGVVAIAVGKFTIIIELYIQFVLAHRSGDRYTRREKTSIWKIPGDGIGQRNN